MSHNNIKYYGGSEISNGFSNYFSNVFCSTVTASYSQNVDNRCLIDFNFCSLSLIDVFDELIFTLPYFPINVSELHLTPKNWLHVKLSYPLFKFVHSAVCMWWCYYFFSPIEFSSAVGRYYAGQQLTAENNIWLHTIFCSHIQGRSNPPLFHIFKAIILLTKNILNHRHNRNAHGSRVPQQKRGKPHVAVISCRGTPIYLFHFQFFRFFSMRFFNTGKSGRNGLRSDHKVGSGIRKK